MTPRNYKLMRQLRDLENLNTAPVRVAIAQKIVEKSQELVPVDTGELRDSIHEEDGNVVSRSDHALPVEFGTVHMEAQPFLRPAVDIYYKEIVEAAAEQMNMQIGEAVGL